MTSSPGSSQQSPHRLVEFLAAISRCENGAAALRSAAELAAEEFDAEVGAVVVGGVVSATVGFGRREAPLATLASVAPGSGDVDLDGLGPCHTLAAAWAAGSVGRLLVARTDGPFTHEDRNLLLGMAGAFGLALDMIGVLERERGQQRVLEVLLAIQRSISHRAPLSTVLAAVTDGASTVLEGYPVSLVLTDDLDPGQSVVVGSDLSAAASTFAAPVHIHGVPAGALVATAPDGAPVGRVQRSLLQSFAEHASLALADARTLEAMHEASRDPLTGLPNRALFLDRLAQALRGGQPSRAEPAVLFIDLDRFKAVNDTLGHSAGDVLLREVADRIGACIPADATAARFGGDEFAVLLPGLEPARAAAVAEGVIAELHEPFAIEDKNVLIGAAVGIAHADPAHPELGADEILANADVAMYRAKAAGGGIAVAYDPGMRVALLARLEMQAHVQVALRRGELAVHYQPVVDLASGRTTGLEALLRWQHPQHGSVPPSDFIPLAEATGAIVPIGRWVLGEACCQLAAWRRTDPDLTMNVNVSVHQLRDRQFLDDVRAALLRAALPGSALTLEITESVLLEDDEHTRTSLRTLAELGVSIALDDFGTGYSALGHLRRFPVDALKIDRSFVSGPASVSGGDQLVRTIIELGRAYGLDVVAEGVEEESQRRRLLALGCRRGQGYLFGRPTDADGVAAHLAAQRAASYALPGPRRTVA